MSLERDYIVRLLPIPDGSLQRGQVSWLLHHAQPHASINYVSAHGPIKHMPSIFTRAFVRLQTVPEFITKVALINRVGKKGNRQTRKKDRWPKLSREKNSNLPFDWTSCTATASSPTADSQAWGLINCECQSSPPTNSAISAPFGGRVHSQ
jgi:hypothetical protein